MLSYKSDAAELGIAAALFSAIAEEMGITLGRSAHSPNIKERRDYSCAVFDPQGRLVAQAAHIPVHLGAMPTAVEAAMPLAPFAPGDIAILNDPYLGGTHLPDITLVSPVSCGGRWWASLPLAPITRTSAACRPVRCQSLGS